VRPPARGRPGWLRCRWPHPRGSGRGGSRPRSRRWLPRAARRAGTRWGAGAAGRGRARPGRRTTSR